MSTALVTGAAGVLCSALVEALLEEGHRVALLGRTESKLVELQKALAAKGLTETLVVAADVLDRSSLEAARAKIEASFGPVDILVNGAGGNSPKATAQAETYTAETAKEKSFFGVDLQAYGEVFDLNLKGTLLPCQVFGDGMAERRRGTIVNLSSMSADRPLTKVIAYSNAKAAVDSLTQWLAVHLAPRGIRVNAIAPGFFLTEQNRFLLTTTEGGLTPRGDKILRNTPFSRFGEAKELKTALKFLVHPDSSFVNGVILPVDGGFSAFAGV